MNCFLLFDYRKINRNVTAMRLEPHTFISKNGSQSVGGVRAPELFCLYFAIAIANTILSKFIEASYDYDDVIRRMNHMNECTYVSYMILLHTMCDHIRIHLLASCDFLHAVSLILAVQHCAQYTVCIPGDNINIYIN